MTEEFTEEELNMIYTAISYTRGKLEDAAKVVDKAETQSQIQKTLGIIDTTIHKLENRDPSYTGEEMAKIYVSLYCLSASSEQALPGCKDADRNTLLDCKVISNRAMRKIRKAIPGIESCVLA